jgi:hypothetical protein
MYNRLLLEYTKVMKFKITFKDPDAVYDAVRDEVISQVNSTVSLEPSEKADIIESRTEKTIDKLKRWIMYGEYVTIEFDTDADTATVVPANES